MGTLSAISGSFFKESKTNRGASVMRQNLFSWRSGLISLLLVLVLSFPALSNDDTAGDIAEDAGIGTSVYNVNDFNTGDDTDLDGETLSYSITLGNTDGHFAIDAGTGVITTAAAAALDYESTNQYLLTVEATDTDSNTDTAVITVNITNVNEPPAITGQTNSLLNTDEDTPLTLSVADLIIDDPDSSSFTLYLVFVFDGEFPSNDYYLNIAVTPINDVPEITGQPAAISILENNGAGYTPRLITVADVTINDPDGGPPTITVSAGTNYTSVDNKITPALYYNGPLTVPVTVFDGIDTSNEFDLSITVTAINTAPEITGQTVTPITILEDTSRTIVVEDLVIEDPDDGDSHTVLVLDGTNYTVDDTTITPAPEYFGPLSVLVRARDAVGASSNTFILQVEVTAVNDAPTIDNNSLTITEGTTVILNNTNLSASDEDTANEILVFIRRSRSSLRHRSPLVLCSLSMTTAISLRPIA
ncbi:MAG: cadherin domain-containing protein [Deltaproteobacteria bacterium]|nr:cadherin domain-containing protein [Deltaproteobacteria bacterium]